MSPEFQAPTGTIAHAQALAERNSPFVVVAVFTRDMRNKAERLQQSLRQVALDHQIFEVPTVHSSISGRGTGDLRYSKPNIIKFTSDHLQRPILFVDVDMVFREPPSELNRMPTGTHFAIYNWLADPAATDVYQPATVDLGNKCYEHRFFRFAHSIDLLDPQQALVSGAVQLHTPENSPLLLRWLHLIAAYPSVNDDELLSYAYNTMVSPPPSFWLTKNLCRYPWWIFDKPVIDHPEWPALIVPERSFLAHVGRLPYKAATAVKRRAPPPVPRECLIDVVDKRLCRPTRAGDLQILGGLERSLWISDRLG